MDGWILSKKNISKDNSTANTRLDIPTELQNGPRSWSRSETTAAQVTAWLQAVMFHQFNSQASSENKLRVDRTPHRIRHDDIGRRHSEWDQLWGVEETRWRWERLRVSYHQSRGFQTPRLGPSGRILAIFIVLAECGSWLCQHEVIMAVWSPVLLDNLPGLVPSSGEVTQSTRTQVQTSQSPGGSGRAALRSWTHLRVSNFG